MLRRRTFRPPIPPPLPSGHVVDLPGRGEVFYRRDVGGEPGAPTLLLLHGWTASADLQWFTAYDALAARYPFVAIDHRGHGRGLRSTQPFTLEATADDAAALVRALGLERVITIGYSMGGPVALLVAQRHPDLVAGMVVEATALDFSLMLGERIRWRALPLLEAVVRSRVSRWFTNRWLAREVENAPELDQWVPWILAEIRRNDPTAIAEAGRSLARFDAGAWAGELGVPAASVVTTADRLVAPSRQRALAEALDAEVFELDGDHQVTVAQPAAFAAATRRAVDAVSARVG